VVRERRRDRGDPEAREGGLIAVPRTIVVGDVHGTNEELDALLAKVAFSEGDRLVMVGDLVARGPDSAAVVRTVRRLGGRAVRGNHEDRLLRLRREGPRGLSPRLRSIYEPCLAALTPEELDWLASLPLWLDLPAHGARVVHAGVIPGIPIEQQAPRTLMYVRSVENGRAIEERGYPPWSVRYGGPVHMLFGHYAREEVMLHGHATGLDTGAVYGGRLTALVLADDEQVPPDPDERAEHLVQVRARKAYWPK
jgi:hypothetical protein